MISLRSQTPKGQRARASILAAAEGLLVTRGFHGTSMRDIAKEAGLPLATVVYHFTKKERLYSAVLFDIADELTQGLAGATTADDMARVLVRWSVNSPRRVVLLLRELLDNPARIAKASKFPLAPFMLRASELAREVGAPQPELAVLQIVGAVSYVVASKPTVDRIVGPARAKQMAAAYEADMLQFARRVLGIGERKSR
ncbi:MAG: TetR/AcrR family transcriptional regulator [Kofleriaceae bacterium]